MPSIYGGLLDTTVAIQVGTLAINKPLVLWINDGLMAIFFFLIGLEIKREVLEGELSSFSQIVLPGAGALGGMVVTAAIYSWFNWGKQSLPISFCTSVYLKLQRTDTDPEKVKVTAD